MIKIGIIGLGKMGQNHLRHLSLLKQAQVVFLHDIDQSLCKKLSEAYQVRVCKDLDSELQQVDGVIISTPTVTHYEYIEQVSKYVKNIFVEKPLTDKVETAYKVIELCREKSLNIQVGFIERYNPALSAMIPIVKDKNHVINMDFIRTGKASARITDVDVVMDLMIHDIDLALSINGPIKDVQAYGYVGDKMIDYARATLYHTSGVFSNILASRVTEKKMRKLLVTSHGMYINCNLLTKELTVNRNTSADSLEFGLNSHQEEVIDIDPQDGLMLQMNDFIKLCNGQATHISNQHDGLSAIQIAQQIQDLIY